MSEKATAPADARLEIGWDDLVPIVLKSQGIKSGLWSFGIRFNLAAINAGPGPDDIMPTALASAWGISLRAVSEPGALVYDAATMRRTPAGPPQRPQPRERSKAKAPARSTTPKR